MSFPRKYTKDDVYDSLEQPNNAIGVARIIGCSRNTAVRLLDELAASGVITRLDIAGGSAIYMQANKKEREYIKNADELDADGDFYRVVYEYVQKNPENRLARITLDTIQCADKDRQACLEKLDSWLQS